MSKCICVYFKKFGCSAFSINLTVGKGEGFLNMRLYSLIQRYNRAAGFRLGRCCFCVSYGRQFVKIDRLRSVCDACVDKSPLNDILQLSYISRPAINHEAFHGAGRKLRIHAEIQITRFTHDEVMDE